ncbi:MAG: helix-turn-helix transcriptional regulator [Eubacteriales bacterium]|nr:helix-turn-helix transcriptional regulator [Eubacteriales bacterium]
MQEIFLGEVIRQKRLELGLTQEQVCEGICDPITISRIENGKQTPNRTRINAILERLDLPADRYWAMLSKNELEIEALQKQITEFNVQFEHASKNERPAIRKAAFENHQKLEAMIEKGDTVSRQMILRSRVLLGKESEYSIQEQRAMLMDAIRLTVPSFDIDEIGKSLYTSEEIKIINLLATGFSRAGEHMEAISILSQLCGYIRKHFKDIPVNRTHFSMIAYNYARELGIIGQYEKAIQIAEEGRAECLASGYHLPMPRLLDVMAECYYYLGDEEKSRDLFYQSYYLFKAFGDGHNRELVKKDAQRCINLVFEG